MDLALALSTVQNLSEEDRQNLVHLVSTSRHGLWSPNPGPQSKAYYSRADELFYGGAAGGGKSALVIGLALTQHQRSLIIRRESTQLRGMIDDIARTIRTRDGLNKQEGTWRLPQKATTLTGISEQLIEFGGVPNPGDEERHQGIPHDLLAFDEATQLPEYLIDYLSTWCRTTNPNQRTRIVLTSNPPTPSTAYNQRSSSGQWVIRRYAPWLDPSYADPFNKGPAQPGELRWFVTLDGRDQEWPDALPFTHHTTSGAVEIIRPKSRTFIPARVHDNPFLHQTDYESQLQKLGEPLRSAMLYGDFSISLSDKPLQLIPADWLRAAQARHREVPGTDRPPNRSRPLTSIGVDVARGGTDSTVLIERYGPYYAPPVLIPSTTARTGPEVATHVLRHSRNEAPMVIDANGVGASVYDHLSQNLGLENAIAWVGSTQSHRRDQSNKFGFPNRRSEVYWRLREALDPSSQVNLMIPDDPELTEELLSMTWEEQNGKIKVIAKKDLIKILGRSPDKADALTLAFSVNDEDDPILSDAQSRREARVAEAQSLRSQPGLDENTPIAATRRVRWSDRRLPRPTRW